MSAKCGADTGRHRNAKSATHRSAFPQTKDISCALIERRFESGVTGWAKGTLYTTQMNVPKVASYLQVYIRPTGP